MFSSVFSFYVFYKILLINQLSLKFDLWHGVCINVCVHLICNMNVHMKNTKINIITEKYSIVLKVIYGSVFIENAKTSVKTYVQTFNNDIYINNNYDFFMLKFLINDIY